jgi:hypothetical protein
MNSPNHSFSWGTPRDPPIKAIIKRDLPCANSLFTEVYLHLFQVIDHLLVDSEKVVWLHNPLLLDNEKRLFRFHFHSVQSGGNPIAPPSVCLDMRESRGISPEGGLWRVSLHFNIWSKILKSNIFNI